MTKVKDAAAKYLIIPERKAPAPEAAEPEAPATAPAGAPEGQSKLIL